MRFLIDLLSIFAVPHITIQKDGHGGKERTDVIDGGCGRMKLIIDISEEAKKHIDTFKGKFLCGDGCDMIEAIQNGTPLANDSERAEVQAYFAGEAYGWEQGRKALIDDLKAEIESLPTEKIARCRIAYIFASEFKPKVLEILDNIGKESEE